MCGRYTLAKTLAEIEEIVGDLDAGIPLAPRYNIAPSQPVLSILGARPRRLTFTQWGLIPSWAKDPTIGSRLVNARSETAAEKPAFRSAFARCRCLIPADGFYEWAKVPGQRTKQPMYIHLRSGAPFAFAGLWSEWHGPDGTELTTSTILTTEPNDLVKSVHSRMPVILPADAYDAWLDPGTSDADALTGLLIPYPADAMTMHAVSTRMNNVRHDAPDCIAPAADAPPEQLGLF